MQLGKKMKNSETTITSRVKELENFLNKQREYLLEKQSIHIKFLTTELEKNHKFSIALIIALGISVSFNLYAWLWMLYLKEITDEN